jgi:hypothetical protein
MNAYSSKVQAGGENQLEKGEALQDLLRLDPAEDELRTVQDRRAWPRLASSIRQDLTQESAALATVVTIAVTILEPLTVITAI